MMAAWSSLHRRPVVSAVQAISPGLEGNSSASQYVRSRGKVVCPSGHELFTLSSLTT